MNGSKSCEKFCLQRRNCIVKHESWLVYQIQERFVKNSNCVCMHSWPLLICNLLSLRKYRWSSAAGHGSHWFLASVQRKKKNEKQSSIGSDMCINMFASASARRS